MFNYSGLQCGSVPCTVLYTITSKALPVVYINSIIVYRVIHMCRGFQCTWYNYSVVVYLACSVVATIYKFKGTQSWANYMYMYCISYIL